MGSQRNKCENENTHTGHRICYDLVKYYNKKSGGFGSIFWVSTRIHLPTNNLIFDFYFYERLLWVIMPPTNITHSICNSICYSSYIMMNISNTSHRHIL